MYTVTGADNGYTAYNGTYNANGTYNSHNRYTNSSNYDIYFHESGFWVIGEIDMNVYWVSFGGLITGTYTTQCTSSDVTVSAASSGSTKTFNGLAKASVKTNNNLAIASVKTINGNAV